MQKRLAKNLGAFTDDIHLFDGFKGHLLISMTGIPTTYTFTSAEVDERKLIPKLVDDIKGFVIADKGLIDFELQTPLRSNMKDDRDKTFVKRLVSTITLVEKLLDN